MPPELNVWHVVTFAAGIAVPAAGFLLRRALTGARHQERVTLYGGLAEIAAKMKTAGVSQEDVEAVDAYVRGKRQRRTALAKLPGAAADAAAAEAALAPSSSAEEPEGYWTQAAMNQRAAASYATAIAQLREVLLELEHYDGAGLWEAQAAWEAFRDKQAELAAAEFEGGSIVPLIRASEAASLTEERIAWARARLAELKAR